MCIQVNNLLSFVCIYTPLHIYIYIFIFIFIFIGLDLGRQGESRGTSSHEFEGSVVFAYKRFWCFAIWAWFLERRRFSSRGLASLLVRLLKRFGSEGFRWD